MFIILLLCGYLGVELGLLELSGKLLRNILNSFEVFINIIDLLGACQYFVTQILSFLSVRICLLLHLGIAHCHDLFKRLHLLVQVFVVFLETVRLLTELVDVIKECDILFLCLDEGCHDLFNTGDASRLHNRLKCFLNDLCISDILLQQSPLLFILICQIRHSNLQNLYWVCKVLFTLPGSLGVFHSLVETLLVILKSFIFLFQLLL